MWSICVSMGICGAAIATDVFVAGPRASTAVLFGVFLFLGGKAWETLLEEPED